MLALSRKKGEALVINNNIEITILEITRTAIVQAPIPRALVTDVLTASAGHMPSIMIKTGFSFMMPL